MSIRVRTTAIMGCAALALLVLGGGSARLAAKEHGSQVSSDDPTLRLYTLLDSKYNGKVDDLYLLADKYSDPKSPGPAQHVIHMEYDKDHAFGKLKIHVRSVGQLTPEQLKTYNAKQIFDFADSDSEKFTKTDPGTFGRTGDLFVETNADGSILGSAAVTQEVQTQYDLYITQYLLPALEKK